MASWLQKIMASPPQIQKSSNLPAEIIKPAASLPQTLPNATIIYGIGASLLFVASFFLLVEGRWFPALVVFALGACLTGFALHLLKHQD